jgi:hypothetical protein
LFFFLDFLRFFFFSVMTTVSWIAPVRGHWLSEYIAHTGVGGNHPHFLVLIIVVIVFSDNTAVQVSRLRAIL